MLLCLAVLGVDHGIEITGLVSFGGISAAISAFFTSSTTINHVLNTIAQNASNSYESQS